MVSKCKQKADNDTKNKQTADNDTKNKQTADNDTKCKQTADIDTKCKQTAEFESQNVAKWDFLSDFSTNVFSAMFFWPPTPSSAGL